MSVDKRLTYIANAIHAANKINDTYRNFYKSRSQDNENLPSKIDMVRSSMNVVTDYCPESHRERFGKAFKKTNLYTDTFIRLREYIMTANSRSDRREHFINLIGILQPVADTRSRYLLDKIIKLYEILHS
ncbi:MAG TPA: hypothetical protein GXX49_06050 [Clostridiaceae bacterium]|jgi:hypothetical protein|nr:hypothetical protein [Clostridiaceae bacterium]